MKNVVNLGNNIVKLSLATLTLSLTGMHTLSIARPGQLAMLGGASSPVLTRLRTCTQRMLNRLASDKQWVEIVHWILRI